ncbi:hypothetical protein [Nitratireductor sp. ZSWI3]|uniref:hypothetical protein n=1 Tax=Nitratireductor sp. ZSWI3 TaxID=2966359 RepID=UPI00214F6905|nr:hypothetical protein [Nitratireductor sp. ZSWI3]MCR4266331.1 hypothetical protein [Nitratireductor sp. ZSWI3]
MAADQLASILTGPAGPIPLYLHRFAIEVGYSSSYSGENRESIEDGVRDLESALRAGFFAWSHFPQRNTASLSLDWSPANGFVLTAKASGLHHNVLVAAVRMIANLHHTPLAAHESAKATLGDDADALPARLVFSEVVTSIRIASLKGVDSRLSTRQDFDVYLADDEIVIPQGDLPADVTTCCEGERLTVASNASAPAFPDADLDALEDAFLRLCDSGCFRSVSKIDEFGGDAELFARSADDDRTEIVVDDYRDEYYGIVELANCLSGGRAAGLTISVDA